MEDGMELGIVLLDENFCRSALDTIGHMNHNEFERKT